MIHLFTLWDHVILTTEAAEGKGEGGRMNDEGGRMIASRTLTTADYPLPTIHYPLFFDFGAAKTFNNSSEPKSLSRQNLRRPTRGRIPLDMRFRKRGTPKRRRRKLLSHNALRPHGAADGSLLAGEACLKKTKKSRKPGKTALASGCTLGSRGQRAEDRRQWEVVSRVGRRARVSGAARRASTSMPAGRS